MHRAFMKKGTGWLVSVCLPFTLLAAMAGAVQAHNLDEIASKMAGKWDRGAVPIGGAFSLMDTAGKKVTEKTYVGKLQLIFFGFTSCPDVCSTVMQNVAAAMAELGADAAKVQPIFITMDPAQDTPKRLTDYLNAFDSRIVGLRGDDAQTLAAIKAFHVYSKRRETGTLDHSAMVYVMKPDGSFGKLLNADAKNHKLADELRTTLLQSRGS